MFCAKQAPCNGRFFDCQFFHADAWVCMSQDQDRNYDWIEYENGIQLGTQGQCISKHYGSEYLKDYLTTFYFQRIGNANFRIN